MRTGPRATPDRLRTRVITDGVTPSLHVDYKHATIKQIPHGEKGIEPVESTLGPSPPGLKARISVALGYGSRGWGFESLRAHAG